MRKRLTKKERIEIYNKYNGHCAYCGKQIELNAFHVDHINPVREMNGIMDNPENDTTDNLTPSCRSCNMRKGSGSVEFFREQMERSVEVLRRDSVAFKFAERYEQIQCTPHKVVFYFEKVGNNK